MSLYPTPAGDVPFASGNCRCLEAAYAAGMFALIALRWRQDIAGGGPGTCEAVPVEARSHYRITHHKAFAAAVTQPAAGADL